MSCIIFDIDKISFMNSKKNQSNPSQVRFAAADENQTEEVFALGKANIKLIGIAFLMIIIGFLLMLGGGSTADTYNPDIFSFRRIVLAPGIAFAGFVFMVYAIMYKSKKGKENEGEKK